MPNRDHDDSLRNRSADRSPRRDDQGHGDQGERKELGRDRQNYAPEWRSYAQDWSDHGRTRTDENGERAEDAAADDRAENPFQAQERTRQEWNRKIGAGHYARESYGPSFGGSPGHDRGGRESWGEQLRHAGMQMVSRVKGVFGRHKGYRRADDRIRADIDEGLSRQEDFDPSDLDVSVTGGEATLTGTVRSRPERFIAEEIASEVTGVHEVHNQIHVRRVHLRSTGVRRGPDDSSEDITLVQGKRRHEVPRA